MANYSNRSWETWAPWVKGGLPILILVILGVSLITSGYDRIQPGEAGVIINNITKSITTRTTEGVEIHMPWGLTDVYVVDVTPRRLTMQGREKVSIKTREGATVETNVEMTYRVSPNNARSAVQRIGIADWGAGLRTEKLDAVVKAYARTKIRDTLGELNLTELAQPEARTARIKEAQDLLNQALFELGIDVITVSATDWDYNDEYEELIKKRKQAEQLAENQEAAQEKNRQEQERSRAEQERIKANDIIEAEGDAAKALIQKEAWAMQTKTLAEGEAIRTRKEAEAQKLQFENQAKALLAELTNRATGVEALAEAYAKTGLGLVRETLAAKFQGVQISGSPYTRDATPTRLEVDDPSQRSPIGRR
ncbi:MAG: SPFH domain-containing protein [Planctomycetota bacterium]